MRFGESFAVASGELGTYLLLLLREKTYFFRVGVRIQRPSLPDLKLVVSAMFGSFAL